MNQQTAVESENMPVKKFTAGGISFGDADSSGKRSFHFTLLLTGTKAEAPRGSGDVAAGQLDVQVTSDVDLDELGQPHVVRHECEPFDQSVLGPVDEVNDTPPVQWSRFVAANRVLDVKQRLPRTGAKKVPVEIGNFRCSDESNLLLRGVEADLFQDQPRAMAESW